MKKFYLFALAAAGLLFGACSTESVEVAEPENGYGLIAGESSWLAVGIAMPGDPVTRANEDLDDGTPDEYAVKSGTLYLFKGANEDEAKFFQSFEINTTFSNETGDVDVPEGSGKIGNITSTSQRIVQEIENPDLGIDDKLYAYVILNGEGNATGITATVNTTTGADFKAQQLKAIGIATEADGFGAMGTKGLVMTNVPIATVPGGDSEPTNAEIITFTEIDKNAIFKTKKEAEEAKAATCIYVERAAVKVEVAIGDNFGIVLDGNGDDLVTVTDVKWALGNVNVAYYNTRQFDTEWLPYNNTEIDPTVAYLKYRMVGRTPFFKENHNPKAAYRTYFGKDINYTGEGNTLPLVANTGLKYTQLADDQYTLESGDVVYTYENTFDEKSQTYENTTYVGVKAKINPNGDFYTIQGQPNTILKDETDIAAVAKTRLRDVINEKITDINAYIGTAPATLFPAGEEVTYDVTAAVTLGAYDATTGEQAYTVELDLANVKVGGNAADNDQIAALKTAGSIGVVANPANSTVYKYVGGYSYYATRIQHFGDVETPWKAPAEAYNIYFDANGPCDYPEDAKQTIVENGVTKNYDFGANRASAWLGRWGIVRNNWYSLTLKKISGIGSPVPEDFKGNKTPDDNPPTSYFISAEVHILPWVKRTQEVEL